jgi:hypothetical protein
MVAPAWYNGYRFVLTFIVCTSIVFNLIVKEYLQDTGAHGKLDNLKSQRHNLHGTEFGDKVEESAKQKSPYLYIVADDRKNMLKQGGKKTKPDETPKKKGKKQEEEEDDEE